MKELMQRTEFNLLRKSFMLLFLINLILSGCTTIRTKELKIIPINIPFYILKQGDLEVKVMDPNSEARIYKGVRFSNIAAVLQVTYKGKSYFYEPTKVNAQNELHGLAMEFDICDPDNPLAFDAVRKGQGFVKLGVGVLQKNTTEYNFSKEYPVIARAPTSVEWQTNKVTYTQICEYSRNYAYSLIATLELSENSMTITYTLTNTGRRLFSTSQYHHNFLNFSGKSVGPDYSVQFPYPIQLGPNAKTDAEVRKKLPDFVNLKEKEFEITRPIPSHMQLRIPRPVDFSGAEKLTISQRASGQSLDIETAPANNKTAVFAIANAICPEQFLTLFFLPGEKQTWKRIYTFHDWPSPNTIQ